jgi:CheY-like chemotaxis protein
MPEMNGFEATDYIHKTMNLKFNNCFNCRCNQSRWKCKEFGLDDYIPKPINENLLYSKIVELVKKVTIIIDGRIVWKRTETFLPAAEKTMLVYSNFTQ